ncbi:MAG: glycosyltransferase, partial [Actinomycetota bacterium]|nr:glycosyltransferase [Actinomycetota bacterium]
TDGRLWLFVGRFVPNKCQHDVVRAFAAYRRKADPGATLLLIGSAFTGTYRDAVIELAGRLQVADGLIARGPVTSAELTACFQAADVFVCLSEHEGFCVPLVEAMAAGLPVVAYAAAAVPETAGDAAVLLDQKDPVLVGATVAELLDDDSTREALVQRGFQRAEALSPEKGRRILTDLVQGLVV